MAGILVTVGMTPYPFDRLVTAVTPLCAYHDVFVQTGVSAVVPPCPHAGYVGLDEFRQRLAEVDIVITHAGGTVRLVQRLGRLPIVVARSFRRGEAPDDSQARFLHSEESYARVQAVWDLDQLVPAVAAHGRLELRNPPPAPVPAGDLVAAMESLSARLVRGQ